MNFTKKKGHYFSTQSTPGDARSKARVCGCSLAGIAGLNPTGGTDVCLVWVLCVARKKSLKRGRSLVQRNVTECGVSDSNLSTSTMIKPDLRTQDIKPAVCFHYVTSGLLTKFQGSYENNPTIRRSSFGQEDYYRFWCVWVCSRNLNNEEAYAHVRLPNLGKKQMI
jgi:hypothetical protein